MAEASLHGVGVEDEEDDEGGSVLVFVGHDVVEQVLLLPLARVALLHSSHVALDGGVQIIARQRLGEVVIDHALLVLVRQVRQELRLQHEGYEQH